MRVLAFVFVYGSLRYPGSMAQRMNMFQVLRILANSSTTWNNRDLLMEPACTKGHTVSGSMSAAPARRVPCSIIPLPDDFSRDEPSPQALEPKALSLE